MTIRELATQLHTLTNGHINGEAFTKTELIRVISMWTRDMSHNKITNSHVIEVELPDGNWLATIDHYGTAPDTFGYHIPESREEEQRLWKRLTSPA